MKSITIQILNEACVTQVIEVKDSKTVKKILVQLIKAGYDASKILIKIERTK